MLPPGSRSQNPRSSRCGGFFLFGSLGDSLTCFWHPLDDQFNKTASW